MELVFKINKHVMHIEEIRAISILYIEFPLKRKNHRGNQRKI